MRASQASERWPISSFRPPGKHFHLADIVFRRMAAVAATTLLIASGMRDFQPFRKSSTPRGREFGYSATRSAKSLSRHQVLQLKWCGEMSRFLHMSLLTGLARLLQVEGRCDSSVSPPAASSQCGTPTVNSLDWLAAFINSGFCAGE